MSDVQLSSTTKSLLRAARGDAPQAVARAKMWKGVAAAAQGGFGAGAAATAASSTKLLAAGALFGSAVTVGLAMVLLHVHVGPAPSHTQSMAQPPETHEVQGAPEPATQLDRAAADEAPTSNEASVDPPTVQVQALPRVPSKPKAIRAKIPPPTERPEAAISRQGPSDEDVLMHEASMVAEARGALMRGDPAGALRSVRAARALPTHQLEPEEMSIEAQALRVLGRADESFTVDEDLKSRYPEHPLSR